MYSNVDEVAILEIDTAKKIHYVSESVKSVLGYSEEELKTSFFFDILGDANRDIIEMGLSESKPIRFETVIYNKDSKPSEIEVGLFPSHKPGNCVYTLFISNISARNHFQEQHGWLSEIVNTSDDAIISKTMQGVITSWNPAAEVLFGYPKDEVIGKHISLIIPAERMAEENMIMDIISRGEKIQHFETIRIAKDGSEKSLSITISPIKNHEDKIIGASNVSRDISAQKATEKNLATLAAIVDSSDDAIISKTLEGIITSWNSAAGEMFDYTEEEVIGRHISLIIPPDRIEEESMIIENIREGRKIDHFETVRMSKSGKRKNISLTVSPIKNAEGKIIGASKIARDVDFKVFAEQQREHFIKRLQELNEYKDEFMVMASHELKTPLTVILANLQILQELIKDDQNIILVKKIIDKVFQMSTLITNLLDVSKIQAGRLELEKSSFNIQNQIREIVSNLQATTQKHVITLSTSHPNTIIFADRERLQHVLVNLLGNAIKYSPKGGKINVNFSEAEDTVEVSVSDEGVGIHHSDLENIFQRFYRGRIASSFSGSGVGLYISAQIIKEHDGEIRAESKEGKGSTFYYKIPK